MQRLHNSTHPAISKCFRSFLLLPLLAALFLTSHTYAQAVFPGIVPVQPPTHGLRIDGDILTNMPVFGIGDWFAKNGVDKDSAVFYLNSSGSTDNGNIATLYSKSWYKWDRYTTQDNTFVGGLKKNGNLGDYKWKSAKASPSKCDINNLLVHIEKAYTAPELGAEGDIWITLAGDRESVNGNSFISIALLQGGLTQNDNGTFTSGAPSSTGGRTDKDVQISAEFTGGGTNPNLYLEVWKQVNGVWQWTDKALLDGEALGSTNVAILTGLPYKAFGKSSYPINSFIEVSFNISAIYDRVGCIGAIKSMFVMTKSSQSVTADLADFVEPIPINLDISTSAPTASPDAAYCIGQTIADVTASGETGAIFNWYTALDGDGNPTGTPTAGASYTPSISNASAGSATYYVTQTLDGCESDPDSVTITINANVAGPDVTIEPISCNSLSFSLKVTTTVGGTTYHVTQTGGYDQELTPSADGDEVIFTGLTFGGGYSITATPSGGCTSDANTCDAATGKTATTSQVAGKTTTQVIKLEGTGATKVLAAPNPFNDRIRFSLQSAVSGQGTLDLYNTMGQRVQRVYQGYIEKGQTKVLDYNVAGAKRGNLTYVFQVGDQKITGTLINLK